MLQHSFPGMSSSQATHQIFLEPEGLQTTTVYPNGLNTAFPPEIQLEMLRTIKGLENVTMIRPVH